MTKTLKDATTKRNNSSSSSNNTVAMARVAERSPSSSLLACWLATEWIFQVNRDRSIVNSSVPIRSNSLLASLLAAWLPSYRRYFPGKLRPLDPQFIGPDSFTLSAWLLGPLRVYFSGKSRPFDRFIGPDSIKTRCLRCLLADWLGTECILQVNRDRWIVSSHRSWLA